MKKPIPACCGMPMCCPVWQKTLPTATELLLLLLPEINLNSVCWVPPSRYPDPIPVSYTHLSPHFRQIATLGLPNLPAKSLLLSDDITIPYPVPSILIAQFSFISLPHLIHSLTFYLPSPVHLSIYFPIFFRFNQHIVKLMRSSLVSPNVKGGDVYKRQAKSILLPCIY